MSDDKPVRGAEFWDDRYRSSKRVWSGNPNPQLVAEAAGIAPGRALDVGCGEGADAIWLAEQGWEVVGMDISQVALDRAAEHARTTAPGAAKRITWQQADLIASPPPAGSFDLVNVQFMHLPRAPRAAMFRGLAAAVRPDGTLLIVAHHPSDLASGVKRPPDPELYYTADDVAELLGDDWTVDVRDARPRTQTTAGAEVTVHDTVFRARRRPRADAS